MSKQRVMTPGQIIRTFFKGMGSILDIAPDFKIPPKRTDLENLKSDWQKIGDDMRKVMNDHR